MADAMMMFLGEAHGVNWYWAQPGEFENPGVYYWDGVKNVLCVPHLVAAPEAPATAVVQKAAAWVPVHPKTGPLWAMTTDSPDPERLPAYPLRSLYYTHPALAAEPEAPAQANTRNHGELNPADVRVEVMSAHRQGFALRNGHGIRLIHMPTGAVVECDTEHSQHRNSALAWECLAKLVAEPTSYSHLAEQVSRLMTIGGATITERQQDVLAAALKALEVGMPTRYPITPERVTPDMRTDDEKLADLRGNPPVADYEHKKPDDTEGGAL